MRKMNHPAASSWVSRMRNIFFRNKLAWRADRLRGIYPTPLVRRSLGEGGLKPILFFILFSFQAIITLAQDTEQVEMADTLRSNGKIYVVISVIALIFLGIIGYLVMIDRKLRKMEQEIRSKQAQN